MLAAVVIAGIGSMFATYRGLTFQSFLIGLFAIAMGAILARIWSELIMVLFKINEVLQEIRKK